METSGIVCVQCAQGHRPVPTSVEGKAKNSIATVTKIHPNKIDRNKSN